MFENQHKKSERLSHNSKNNSTSRSKLPKKGAIYPIQKIMLDGIKTDEYHKEQSNQFKQKKGKSQSVSKQMQPVRKSIDVSKLIKTTRCFVSTKSKEKVDKNVKLFEQLSTDNPSKHQNLFISNAQTQNSTQLKWVNKNSTLKAGEGKSVERKKLVWNQKIVPLDPLHILEHYSHYLTKYEQNEIRQYKKIYYIGHKAAKSQGINQPSITFDNEEKQYKYIQNDHIAYRYELLSLIGKGSYGQVFRVHDHKHKEQVALKIIKNDPKCSKQAFNQIKILSLIKEQDQHQQSYIVKIKDFVIFRKHVCIIFQLLSQNLYELIIRNNYNGLSQELIRRFAIQILGSVQFLRKNKIIHCDLKPQNILLRQYNKSGITIIDLGSSCFQAQTIFTYIQSRYYRAPQITLGIPYDHRIDIWSTGCILAELYTGVPVFPGQNQFEQIKYITDTIGAPPRSFLGKGCRKSIFFDQEGRIKPEIKQLKTSMQMFSKPLKDRIQDQDFFSFIEAFLKWDPNDRITSTEALSHKWIMKGLPEELKKKLSVEHKELAKSHPKRQGSGNKVKGKSKDKINTTAKLVNKSSQQKLKRGYYGLKC